MTLLLALTVAVVFAAGTYLLLKPDLVRVVAGVLVISHAANLTLMSSGRSRGRPPVAAERGDRVADPLVQAMTLTAIVIGFAVAALLLAIVYRVYVTHETVDLEDLSRHDVRAADERRAEEVET